MRHLLRWSLLLAALASPAVAASEAPAGAEPEDAALLAEGGIDVARRELSERGELAPFGFLMTLDGRVQRMAPKRGVELPDPQALLGLLESSFRERAAAGECRAVALVADVVISLPGVGQTDAVQVGVEHRSGWCADYFYPYRRSTDGTLSFEPRVVRPRRKGTVFDACR